MDLRALRLLIVDDNQNLAKNLRDVLEGSELDAEVALAPTGRQARDHAKREGFADAGYRIVINCNGDGGQTVFQVHLHLLAGAPLGHFGTAARR